MDASGNAFSVDSFVKDVCEWRNTNPQIVKDGLELVLTTVLSEHFQGEAYAEIENGMVRAWFYRNHAYVPIEFHRLPAEVTKAVRQRLPECLTYIEDEQNYRMWRERIHTVMRGTIVRITIPEIHVELNGWVATMMRHRWNSRDGYKCGNSMMFYIDKVLRPCRVFVSRNSISFGPALLRHYYPWGQFQCIKRLVGVKSIIVTDTLVKREHIKEISEEMGEILILKRDPKVFDQKTE